MHVRHLSDPVTVFEHPTYATSQGGMLLHKDHYDGKAHASGGFISRAGTTTNGAPTSSCG